MLIEKAKLPAFWAFLGALVGLAFSNSIFEIFSGIYLALTLFVVVGQKHREVFKGRTAMLALLYLAVVLLSLLGSAYWDNSLKGAFRVFRCVLMCFFSSTVIDTEKKFKTAFFVMAWTALVMGLDAWVQAVSGFDLIRRMAMIPFTHQVGRVTGPFSHANDFSAYLCVVFFIFVGMIPFAWRRKQWKSRLFFLSGTVVLGLSLLWTYARGAWMAVALVFVAMAAIKRNVFLTWALVAAA